MKKRIACIDADSLLYKATAEKIQYDQLGKPVLDPLGNKIKIEMSLEESKGILDDLISNILNTTEATHYVIALTTGRCHRYDIYPEYKASRKDKEKPKHFHALKDYCVTKYKAVFHHELEADDICLIYSKALTNEDTYAFMCSLDKDLLHLEGTHFNYDKSEWVQTSKKEADDHLVWDLIVGQSGDSIKGIEGIGKVGAEKMLKKAMENPNFSNLELILGGYFKKYGLEKGIEELYKNYQLLKIKDSWPNFKVEEPIEYKRPQAFDITLIDY